MILKPIIYLAIFCIAVSSLKCTSPKNSALAFSNSIGSDTSELGLKDYYKEYFPIGAAIAPRSLSNMESELIKKEFNSVTLENHLKLHNLVKKPGVYDWKIADSLMRFAVENNLMVRGHALCWHDRAPSWYLEKDGKPLTQQELLDKLHEHINTVVTRYKGSIYAWDVVNEAISNEDDEFIEPSPFQKIAGDVYIAKAFEYAHQADPQAKLFYNDYNYINPVKRKKIISLVNSLKSAGIPIHGLGIQGHWSIYGPTEQEFRQILDDVTSTGLAIQITELDISIFPKNAEERKRKLLMTVAGGLNEEELQAKQYEMIFRVLREYRKHITGVTFWNVTDNYSWMDKEDTKHRPLLFDENFSRKNAYQRVLPHEIDK
jgi:endo-1,4-beta-xylanase